jgi:multiple sugar transport system permease protein
VTNARSFSFNLVRHAALVLTSSFALLPFVWMFTTSLKAAGDIFAPFSIWAIIPRNWGAMENYAAVFTDTPMLRFMANGLFVCLAILALQLLIAFPCAYALAKLRFPGRQVLMASVVGSLLIPGQALVLPLFLLFHLVGLLDTYAALIIPHSISVFAIFLFRQFFLTTPDDYVHAARLDGMSEVGVIWRVMVPLAAPAILAFSAFSISSHWNDLLWPMTVVQTRELATAPLGLLFFKSADQGVDYGKLMAAATVVVAPLALVFFYAQRALTDGLGLGGREPKS